VDSDALWVSEARNAAAAKGMDQYRFLFADIGATKLWGYPENPELQKSVLNYQLAPLAAEQEPFDFYLADGRYRVACSCIAFLHAMKHGADMTKVRVGLHDNHDPERFKNYRQLQQIADAVVQNTRLWVYKLKPGVTEEEIFRLWDKNKDSIR
jgi:hypothetical protein